MLECMLPNKCHMHAPNVTGDLLAHHNWKSISIRFIQRCDGIHAKYAAIAIPRENICDGIDNRTVIKFTHAIIVEKNLKQLKPDAGTYVPCTK